MVVSSPLELYTVYLGWRQYDAIWQACSEFGLTWLPFVGLVFQNMTVPFETPFGHGAETSLRRMLIELVLMALFLMVFAVPTHSLRAADVHYKPYCHDEATESTLGHTGTTYDNVFDVSQITNVKLPILLGLTLDWASGFTHALVRTAIPCETDIRQLMQTLQLSRVSFPIREHIERFNQECYLKAKVRFHARKPDKTTYENIMKDYGGDSDLDWMGSHVLRTLYYGLDDMKAQQPVPGFSYGQYPLVSIDEAVAYGEMPLPEWGYPTCETWWSDPQRGLQHAIVNDVNANQPANNYLSPLTLMEQATRWVTKLNPTSKVTAEDVIVRSVLYHARGHYGEIAHVDTNAGMMGAIEHLSLGLNQVFERYFTTPLKRDTISDTLPIIRACILFFVIMFTPLVFILGGYRFGVGLSLCCALFVLVFLDYIWAIDKYLENALLASTTDISFGNILIQHPTLVNIMTDFYFIAAIILLFLFGWAGIKVGSGLDKMISHNANVASDMTSSVKRHAATIMGKIF